MGNTPDKVDVWEALLTFLFFPLLVLVSWMQDVNFCSRHKIKPGTSDAEVGETSGALIVGVKYDNQPLSAEQAVQMLAGTEHAIKDKKARRMSMQQLQDEAQKIALQRVDQQHSRAFWRVHATRKYLGAAGAVPVVKEAAPVKTMSQEEIAEKKATQRKATCIRFQCTSIAVLENCKTVSLSIVREGVLTGTHTVDFATKAGTATSNEDFEETSGTLEFLPDQDKKEIQVKIIDDTNWEDDEDFYVLLSNAGGEDVEIPDEAGVCTVTIIDDDHPGEVQMAAQDEGENGKSVEYEVEESEEFVLIAVERKKGATGKVSVHYKTVDVTAVAGTDYRSQAGELVFEHEEVKQYIRVPLIDSVSYNKNVCFQVVMTDPSGCVLGSRVLADVLITQDHHIKTMADLLMKLLAKKVNKLKLGTTSWTEQFKEAVGPPEEDDAGVLTKIIHYSTVPFKVMFAVVPPTCYWGGWLCFFVSLGFIALVTVLIGDLAGLLGCSLGLKDSVTAITFVALGTSLPDTFASKAAAISDKTADNSIGNVTGSNSVNVFLGLGTPWLIAAIYWSVAGATPEWKARTNPAIVARYPEGGFIVEAGDLGFSVIVFSICACFCLGALMFRRWKFGAELGGPLSRATGIFFLFLWILYITLSAVRSYHLI